VCGGGPPPLRFGRLFVVGRVSIDAGRRHHHRQAQAPSISAWSASATLWHPDIPMRGDLIPGGSSSGSVVVTARLVMRHTHDKVRTSHNPACEIGLSWPCDMQSEDQHADLFAERCDCSLHGSHGAITVSGLFCLATVFGQLDASPIADAVTCQQRHPRASLAPPSSSKPRLSLIPTDGKAGTVESVWLDENHGLSQRPRWEVLCLHQVHAAELNRI
jgi:hypothetical protein